MILDMVACRKSLCSHFSILQDRFSSIFRWISKCIAHGYNRQPYFMLSKTLSTRVNQIHTFCIHQYISNDKYVTEYKRRFWTILWIFHGNDLNMNILLYQVMNSFYRFDSAISVINLYLQHSMSCHEFCDLLRVSVMLYNIRKWGQPHYQSIGYEYPQN